MTFDNRLSPIAVFATPMTALATDTKTSGQVTAFQNAFELYKF